MRSTVPLATYRLTLRVPRTLTDAQAAALLRNVRSRAFRRRLQYLLQPHLPQRPVPVTAAIQPLD
jgi:hypothetical protein